MAFELNISCSKDIDELHIDFSDGSSSVVTKPTKTTKTTNPRKKPAKKETISTGSKYHNDTELNFDEDYDINTEVVSLPEVPNTDRNVHVAEDMKNAEF